MDLKTASKENLQARLNDLDNEAIAIRNELMDRGTMEVRHLHATVCDLYKKNPVDAIKFYRAQTGMGLKDSIARVRAIVSQVCKHCGVSIEYVDGAWRSINPYRLAAQFCFIDPAHGSRLHEPKPQE